MSFASPNMLALLIVVLPLVWYIGFPRYAFRRRRDALSLLLRTILMVLVVLALAGAQWVRQVDQLAVVFLVDASDSIGADVQAEQLAYLQQAVADKPVDDLWSVVVFGANSAVDTPFTALTEIDRIQSTVDGTQTDLESAIQTALSLFPADARRRIVILSDGIETLGDATAKAELAQASGVEISYVLFTRPESADVRIVELSSPAQVNAGQEFDLNITIQADEATPATLLIYSGNQLVDEAPVDLRAGRNNYSLRQTSERTGFLNFSAQIVVDTARDTFTQNNTLGSFSQIVGEPRVLLIASDTQEIFNLQPALEGAGLIVDTIAPASLPADIGSLATYESVIIANVPASDFSEAQMTRLQAYVRDLGGGLVMIGGPQSYGPGGYYQTTLEQVLPIETQIRDQERLPQLTLAYLIDSSGSMAFSNDGLFSSLDLAKRAVTLSLELLQPTDRAAVLTFEAQGALVVPFQDVSNRVALVEGVNSLGTGGGTNILAGLTTAERYMLEETTDLQHLILITDGGSSPRNLVQTSERLYDEAGITLSVVSIGSSPPPFLEQMTVVADGNYHEVRNINQLPSILAQETILATRSYIEEGTFSLARVGNHPILEGIGALPTIRGYVATSPRNTAQVILRSPEPYDDPILTTWQYGLGRSVAFSSDASGRWGQDWVNWTEFSRFWGQVVNYSITENSGNTLETRVSMDDGIATIAVDARTEDGDFLNNLNLQASIIAPDNQTQNVRLQQIAPGQYSASFSPTIEGAYYLAINGTAPDGEQTINQISGWVMSYSAEYAITQANEALLTRLAEISGGRDLSATPEDTFAITQTPRTATTAIWHWLLIAAMVLLPLDIAARRIIVTRRDWQRLRTWLSGGDGDEQATERISSLMAARDRARRKTATGSSDLQAPATPPTDDTPPRSPTRTDTPAPDASGTVSDLLKRRKGRE
ncbi:MAG: VWA domain-containing protein [Anaerolineae bacterium]